MDVTPYQHTETITIAASPEAAYELVADITRMGEWSPVVTEGEWLDEIATRAASQNEQYLEIMQTPSFSNAAKFGNQIGWPQVASDPIGQRRDATRDELAHLRDQLLAAGLADKNIFGSNLCTACDTDLFFSYRKEAANSGRLLAAIGTRSGK